MTTQTILRATGGPLALVGLILTYNFLASPEARVGGHRFDPIKFLGPGLLVAGALMLRERVQTSASHRDDGMAPATAIKAGLALLAVPLSLFLLALIAGSLKELLGFLGTIALAICAIPGLILLVLGIGRRLRHRPPRTP